MSPSGPFDLHPITSPATGARGAEALPDDFAEEAAGRLRIVALVMAGLWSIGIAVNHLIFPYLDLRPEQIVPWTPVSDLVGLGSIALSAAVYYIAPRAARDLERLATIAIAYEVAVAFGIGVVNQWHPVALAGRLSWICVVILLFPLLVPGSTRMVLVGSFLAASMDPVGILITRARGVEVPSLSLVAWTYLPNYICAVLAVIPSKILAHLGQKLTRARQLGSYRLVEQIGRGGMGEVWRAEHRLFARPAAIKLITAQRLEEASSVAEERFRREARGRRRPAVTSHDPALRLRAHPRSKAVLRHGAAGRLRPRVPGQTLRAAAGRTGGVHPSPGVPLPGGGARSRAGAPRHQARQPPYRAAWAGLRLREGAGLRAGEAAAGRPRAGHAADRTRGDLRNTRPTWRRRWPRASRWTAARTCMRWDASGTSS